MPAVTDVQAFMEQVRKRHRRLVRGVFWRDVREVGASVFVAGFFGAMGVVEVEGGWPFFVAAALVLAVGLVIVVDRIRQRRVARAFGESAKDGIGRALMQVNHQIRLLDNVFWWYLLPIVVAYVLVVAHVVSVTHQMADGLPYWTSMVMILGAAALGMTIFCAVYWLNRAAVRKHLVPRRRELEALARALTENEE